VFLGVDQSLRSSGVAVIPPTAPYAPECLLTLEPKKLQGAKRLKFIRDGIQDVVRSYKLLHAALEGYSIGSVNRAFDLGEVGGLIKLTLLDEGVPFIVVPPTSLKLFVTGTGAARKELMQRAVYQKWNLEIDQEDACDAYGLAHVARVFIQGKASHRCELEALKSLMREPRSKSLAFYKPNVVTV